MKYPRSFRWAFRFTPISSELFCSKLKNSEKPAVRGVNLRALPK